MDHVQRVPDLSVKFARKEQAEEFAGRDQTVIDFLFHFFEEENAVEWSQYRKDYLENRYS